MTDHLTLTLNGRRQAVDVSRDTPLLWVLRDALGLTGTKFGCGIGACGACTVHIDGAPVRSCSLPVEAVGKGKVTTIEGLDPAGNHPIQAAWRDLNVPQCGYCQSGMIMAAAALLAENPHPTEADIRENITNICRCGTYHRIVAGIILASTRKQG
ncbi:(2Fe-2S)-binding protein [Niveispirillum sp.]|uniref:(2Fe-2S)-binding protein n=1 Tax=Niveispirillum sp. TaxID=1917217 RepID=UPI001B6B5411|nr:(2Fe-2S)-binding protein [Niveispirillum sp.]MBP7335583.1 (2Fe-2S)-binding protein [Niveispirillum sp.]